MPEALVGVEVESIAAGGDGVARADGLVVFVPRSAPGDAALVRITERGRFARGTLAELRRPSPHRVTPPCPHYTEDRCGGCQLQHLSYPAQLAAKQRIIRDAFQRIGRRVVDPPDVRASDRPWRYRRKLTLALRRRGAAWVAGLHPYDDPAAVFALRDCPITEEQVVDIWRAVLGAGELLPRVPALRASVQVVGGSASLLVEGARSWPEARRFFEALPRLASLWWEPDGGHPRLIAERRATAAGASFAQVNVTVAAALHAHVLELARRHTPRTVVDAYAGIGETALALAQGGATVTAIERDARAAAKCAARLPAPSRALRARVEDALAAALPADIVILNPPRAGVHERVAHTLSRQDSPPRAVIYVSCDPATLARDAARMPGYRVASLIGFDMFPQTAHVETVCELVPEGS